MRNQLVGFIFQSFHLIKELNVYDNVELPLIYRKTPQAETEASVLLEALEKVGLVKPDATLPVPALRRPVPASCNRHGPLRETREIILADEPTGNLDSKIGHEVVGILG
jgi:putative ABC transport system ATP-binding protein